MDERDLSLAFGRNSPLEVKMKALQELQKSDVPVSESTLRATLDLLNESSHPLRSQAMKALDKVFGSGRNQSVSAVKEALTIISNWNESEQCGPDFWSLAATLTAKMGQLHVYEVFLNRLIPVCVAALKGRNEGAMKFPLRVLLNIGKSGTIGALAMCSEQEVWTVCQHLSQNSRSQGSDGQRTSGSLSYIFGAHLLLVMDLENNLMRLDLSLRKASHTWDAIVSESSESGSIQAFLGFLEGISNKVDAIRLSSDMKYDKKELGNMYKAYVSLVARVLKGGQENDLIRTQDSWFRLLPNLIATSSAICPTFWTVEHSTIIALLESSNLESPLALESLYLVLSHVGSDPSVEKLLRKLISSTCVKSGLGAGGVLLNLWLLRVTAHAARIVQDQKIVEEKVLKEKRVITALAEELMELDRMKTDTTSNVLSCTVELLGLLSDLARNKDILDLLLIVMKIKGVTCVLAKGLHSTVGSVLTRSMFVITSVCFSREILKEVTDSLAKVNEMGAIYSSAATTGSDAGAGLLLTPLANMALAGINRKLESFARNKDILLNEKENVSPFTGMPKLMAIYETKQELCETKVKMMQEQLERSEALIKQLSQLTDKCTNMLSLQVAENEANALNLSEAKARLADAEKRILEFDAKLQLSTKELRSQLSHKQKQYDKANQAIDKLKTEMRTLENEMVAVKKNLDNEKVLRRKDESLKAKIEKSLQEKETQIAEAKGKIKELEKAVEEGNEEIKRLEHLLHKERQTVDLIRGFINQGNNM